MSFFKLTIKKLKMRKHYFLLALLSFTLFQAKAQPAAGAPVPPVRSASDVKSLFSEAYTNVAGTDWFPNWGQTTVVSDITIAGNVTKRYATFNYQGVQFSAPVDAASMTSLHLDVWTTNCTSLEVYLINTSPGTVEQKVVLTPTLSGWNTFDIPLSQFNNIALNNIGQFKFVSASGVSTVYLDNIYFWKSANTPTITGFSIPAKLVGDAPFAITPPTSNSPGAFTYTSGNPSVATISGNMITIIGAGTSIITASQAAAGGFGSGTTTASLVVSFAPPATAAPVPNRLAANVLSLYSDSYTNIAGINWNPGWGQSTSTSEMTIGGNNLRKYENMNYQGVEFTGTVNASAMTSLHIDIWTPNATAFEVYLINLSPTVEKQVFLNPYLPGWNSFDIPLSFFSPPINLSSIGQMKFVAAPFGGSTVYVDNIYFWRANPLPVSLVEFKAFKNGNSTSLSWKTLSESNNKGFAIERSVNGIDWVQLQFINGNGNSSVVSNYNATDNNPVKANNLYRLKQLDNDGKATYSPTVTVKFSDVKGLGFSFYPNPAKNILNVQVDKVNNPTATVSLLNTDGKMVRSVVVNKQQANNNIAIDVANVAAGVYMLILKDGDNVKTSKVIIE